MCGSFYVKCTGDTSATNIRQRHPVALACSAGNTVERDNYINRLRLCVGSTMKINNHNSMDFYYMTHFNRSFGAKYDDASGALASRTLKRVTAHVIGVDYKFKL